VKGKQIPAALISRVSCGSVDTESEKTISISTELN